MFFFIFFWGGHFGGQLQPDPNENKHPPPGVFHLDRGMTEGFLANESDLGALHRSPKMTWKILEYPEILKNKKLRN